jgi:hypothetical protein
LIHVNTYHAVSNGSIVHQINPLIPST